MSINSFDDISDLYIEFNAQTGAVDTTGTDLNWIDSVGGSAHPIRLDLVENDGSVVSHGLVDIGAMTAVSNLVRVNAALKNDTDVSITGDMSFMVNGYMEYGGYNYGTIGNVAVARSGTFRLIVANTGSVATDNSTRGPEVHTQGLVVGTAPNDIEWYEDGKAVITNVPLASVTATLTQIGWLRNTTSLNGDQSLGGQSSLFVIYNKKLTAQEMEDVDELMTYWTDHGQSPLDPIAPLWSDKRKEGVPLDQEHILLEEGVENEFDYSTLMTSTADSYALTPEINGFSINTLTGVVTADSSINQGTYSVIVEATNANGPSTKQLKWFISNHKNSAIFPYPPQGIDGITRFDDVPNLWGYWNTEESVVNFVDTTLISIEDAYELSTSANLVSYHLGIDDVEFGVDTLGEMETITFQSANTTAKLVAEITPLDWLEGYTMFVLTQLTNVPTSGSFISTLQGNDAIGLRAYVQTGDHWARFHVAGQTALIAQTGDIQTVAISIDPISDPGGTLYVNNISAPANPMPSLPPTGGRIVDRLIIGGSPTLPNVGTIDGNISIVLIYARHLTNEELTDVHNLMLYWANNGEAPGNGTPPPISDAAQAVLNRMTDIEPGSDEESAIITFVDSQVDSGNWDLIDEFFCFALNNDNSDWLTGWKEYTAEVSGNAAHSPNGFTTPGIGQLNHLNTTINLADLDNYTQDNASAGIYVHEWNYTGSIVSHYFGTRTGAIVSALFIGHHGVDDQETETKLNRGAGLENVFNQADVAETLQSTIRTGGITSYYVNDAAQPVTTTDTSVGLPGDASTPVWLGQLNDGGDQLVSSRNAVYTSFFVGGGDIDITDFYNNLVILHASLGVS